MCDALNNGMQPYEMDLMSSGPEGYGLIKQNLTQLLFEEPEQAAANEQNKDDAAAVDGPSRLDEAVADPLLKYKEHEREKYRERRVRAHQRRA